MKNLVLDDPLNNGKSFSNYRSAMSSLSDTHHPLSSLILVNSAESDPLLSPPPYRIEIAETLTSPRALTSSRQHTRTWFSIHSMGILLATSTALKALARTRRKLREVSGLFRIFRVFFIYLIVWVRLKNLTRFKPD